MYDVVKNFKSKIDSIVYTEEVETYPISKEITFGWESVLSPPPSNTSEVTIKELKYLEQLTKNINIKQRSLIDIVDNEPIDIFKPILKKYNLKFDFTNFEKVWNVSKNVILNVKYKFNRPRPEQLADYFGVKINVIQSKTAETPAFPSGHTCYSALCCYLLADTFPEQSSEFFSQVGVSGYARCLQGVHYPSDNEASMTLSGAIWENIKYKMFPDLYPVRQEINYV